MAAARNNLSRRAVLGAAFVVPAVLGGSPLPLRAAEMTRWDAALTSLREAETALETFRVQHMHSADHAFSEMRRRWPIGHDFARDPEASAQINAALAALEPFEDRLNDLECAKLAAIQRVILTPAPDLPALATKIALAVDYEIAELEGGDRCLAMLKTDAWRLARAVNDQSA